MKLKKEQEQLEKLSQSTLNMHCIICMNRKKEFAVFPCAHMLYCEDCIETVKRNNACFFCNTKINHSTKIFY
jgi:late competence protein required for DNA uptake (superfamily II DNA/RNA helicase)